MRFVARASQPPARRRLVCFGIMLLLIPLGLLCRFVPIGLPAGIVKYGGSFLWAAMIYWLLAFLFVRQRSLAVAGSALVLTAAVEFFKKIHSPGLDGFRSTIAGKVLLGRYFSYTDVAVYWVAVASCAWIDHRLLRYRSHHRTKLGSDGP